jgi:hypothetical protein
MVKAEIKADITSTQNGQGNYSFKYNQQDATLHNILYYCQCSTCFGQFSAHHQELKTVHTASGIPQASCCVYSFELLMMGGETA